MANVPYNQGVPGVTPDARPPDDYQHIDARPEQFGSLIGQGLEKLGQGASTAGKFFGEVQTDDATTNAMKRADDAVNKFRSLRGADALNAQKGTQEEIEAAFKDGRDGLNTPEQQHQYDQVTRSFQLRYVNGIMASHADEQSKIYAANTNNDSANFHLSLIAQNPNDPNVFNANTADIVQARVKQAQIEGRDDTGIAQAAAEGKAEALAARLRSLAVNDPSGAYKLLDTYKQTAGVVDKKTGVSYYDTLANEFRARSDQQISAGKAKTYLDTATQSHSYANPNIDIWQSASAAVPYGFSPTGLARTIRIESGGNPNAVTGHAVGLGQFMPATWAQYGQGDRTDPAQSILATQRYAAANSQGLKQTLGRAPTDAELYLAHQQGLGGAQKLLTNPDARAGSLVGDAAIRNNGGDPNAPAWMFTNMWTAKFNGAPGGWQTALGPGAIPQATPGVRSTAYQMAMADPELNQNPALLQQTFSHINQMTAAQEIAEGNTEKENKKMVETAADEYTKAIHLGQMNPDMLAKMIVDPRFNSDWKTRDTLIDYARSHSGSDVYGASTQYGPGYWDMYKAVTAPTGDPSRITDPTLLYSRAGPNGDLTTAGVEKLRSVMNEMRKSVDAASVQTAKAGLLDYARQKLSFDQEMLFPGVKPLADPKGKAIFDAKFIPKFESAYDAWVTSGKNPWEFLNQDNIDKLMTGLRSKTEMAMDKIKASDSATGEDTEQAIPPPPAGTDVKAWTEVMAARPLAPTGRPISPDRWAQALTLLRADPSADTIEKFKHVWPDVDTKQILEKFGPAKPTAEAAPAAAPAQPEAPAVPAAPPVAPARPHIREEAARGLAEAAPLTREARERQEAIAQEERTRANALFR